MAGITTGKIVDMDFKDSMNMGAAMAMAALDTIVTNFKDLGVDADIMTGSSPGIWELWAADCCWIIS